MNSRQSRNVSLTRLAIRDVLWSFIFIPHVLPCRFLIALKRPGLSGRSTTVAAVDRTGAACTPTRSGPTFSAGDSRAGSAACCPNRPVVTSSTAVPTLTQRADHPGRNRGAPRVSAIHPASRQSPGRRNVSTLIYAAPAHVAGMKPRHRAAQRSKKIFSGFSRTRRRAQASRVPRHARPLKIAECFRPETRMPAAAFSHTRNGGFHPNR